MIKTSAVLVASMLIGCTVVSPVFAKDRAPNEKEMAALSTSLKAAGFVSWEEVELDDDGPYWDIDDARTSDGARYDLKMKPGTLEIFSRDPED